jgi:serine/threonine protein kinase
VRDVPPPPAGSAKISLAPGALIAGKFRLERLLGEGGMGVVWQAVHAVTQKPVALKFLKEPDRCRAFSAYL